MRADLTIAITGAAGVVGRAVREITAKRQVPVERVRLLERPAEEAIISEYAGQAVLISTLEPDSLSDRDLVFLCGNAEESAVCLGWARKRESLFIDLSGAGSEVPEVPVIIAGVNLATLQDRPATIAAPHPIAFALASALSPIERGFGIERAEAVVLRPVSDFGEPGVEELHRQTVGLLNFTDYPREIFGRQVAFNLLPQSALERSGGGTPLEARISHEVAGILGWDQVRLALKTLIAPVFHGHSILVHLEPRQGADRKGLERLLGESEGLAVGPAPEGGVSPVEVAGQKEIRIVEISPDGLATRGFWLSIVASDLAGDAARNAVEIAARLLAG